MFAPLNSVVHAEYDRIEYERLTDLYVQARTEYIDALHSKSEHRIEASSAAASRAYQLSDAAYRRYLGEKVMVLK